MRPASGQEAITRLSRVGYDNTLGYLEGGIDAWQCPRAGRGHDESISAAEFAIRLRKQPLKVFDVRTGAGEWEAGHVAAAEHVPLSEPNAHMAGFSAQQPNYIHCQGLPQHDRGRASRRPVAWTTWWTAGGYGAISGTDAAQGGRCRHNALSGASTYRPFFVGAPVHPPMFNAISHPGPGTWPVPIGLTVPVLLLLGNKTFGISSSLRHICAACFPATSRSSGMIGARETWNPALPGAASCSAPSSRCTC